MDLRQIRLSRNKTLAEVSSQIGSDPGALSRIERGQQLADPVVASAIAKLYGTTLEVVYQPYIQKKQAA